MHADPNEALRRRLEKQKRDLTARLDRITANVRRGYHADSKERAKEFEDREVVDALGNEARDEVAKITAALQRMESGNFGLCVECGARIDDARLQAHPYAEECIECARLEERRGALL
ncbi:MAG: TraR/DksA C4-type zinc finger protein [Proteobacteria bacterium]|nr:TraR/DksA C4-type zinc finger protein [Pseudomonadota bacterium]